MKGVMPDSKLNEAERKRQRRFSFADGVTVVLVAVVAAFASWVTATRADRYPMAARTVPLHLEPLPIPSDAGSPLRLVGAWRLTADDYRFGGLSALVATEGGLLAMSDSGGLFRFRFPTGEKGTVAVSELPDGPGSPALKKNRDSEALVADPDGEGWWVAFENHNEVWRYDRAYEKATGRIEFGMKRWPVNLGIEAMVADKGGLILIPEQAREVVTVIGDQARSQPLTGVGSKISDAARLPDGTIIVLMRDVGLTGFRVSLGVLAGQAGEWHVERRVQLDVGALVNLEGLAVERRPHGGIRLWIVSDDNFQHPLETVLVAFDLPPGGWPGAKSN